MQIRQIKTKKELEEFLAPYKYINQLPEDLIKKLKEQGWSFDNDFCMTKKYQGYILYIEFCIGDYCCYPGSKNNGWLLEKKYAAPDFMSALLHILKLENRIDAGEHWTGEND